MKENIEYYLGLGWGGEPRKVAVPTLRGVQGPRAVFGSRGCTPENIFEKLFNADMWNLIVTETNRYSSPKVRMDGLKWHEKMLTSCRLQCSLKRPK